MFGRSRSRSHRSRPEDKKHIVVIGAGVLGLTAALSLLRTFPAHSYAIHLVSDKFPSSASESSSPSYATPFAGAHYRPVPATTPYLRFEARLARHTYEIWKRIAWGAPEFGVRMCEGIEFVDKGAPALQEYLRLEENYLSQEGFRLLVPDPNADIKGDFKEWKEGDGPTEEGSNQEGEGDRVSADGKATYPSQTTPSTSLPIPIPPETAFACRYDTYTIDTELCALHLLRRFVLDGGHCHHLRGPLRNLHEAFYALPLPNGVSPALVVNCTGTGINDPASYIIRGQTVLVRNATFDSPTPPPPGPEHLNLRTRANLDFTATRQLADGSWSFVIPRPLGGGVIVGGTKQADDWDPVPDPLVRRRLLGEAGRLVPGLAIGTGGEEEGWDVIRDIVGRRPARVGGLRLEVEWVETKNVQRRRQPVVHAYGAGGRGWEMSWGIAEEVVRLGAISLGERALLKGGQGRLNGVGERLGRIKL